jgi:hypothetical protein
MTLSVIFALVGILFLTFPDAPFVFFNGLSGPMGMPPSPLPGRGLYLVLGVGYMYCVALLALLMYRHPADRQYPMLLVNAKGASALLSASMVLIHGPYLIYFANAIVDGSIAVCVAVSVAHMGKGDA